ncbi:hypothetical protein [Gimesia sp.]|uniref:hypothetical protein n=1 Tax=Gimesia sp. TaxID=2024833 RepID=UPI000C3568F2|nr:hypothetical protein [Gimesia sp.]MAX36163.1 hypothetical protein [Gimesia sp.]HAH43415.1 hypothetical protein [Planctomycetaceae bacterium]HBL44078.1 hypothetical protein [Planctomycetaceae bacterium]|tara:strand:- start:1453 stop:2199 length:747 start_codon:yes stop_codon:yes gene_type:complete
MTHPHFTIVLALVFAGSFLNSGFSEEIAESKEEKKTVSAAKVQTLPLDQMILSGEEIDVKIHGDGKRVIRLQGRAGIKIDEMCFSADVIDATCSSHSDLKLDLKGNVKIISSADLINATAAEAQFDFGTNSISMSLTGTEKENVKLIRGVGSRNTQIEATEIQVQFKDQIGMQLKTLGAATFTETKATQSNPFSFPGSRKKNQYQPFSADDQFGPAKFETPKSKKKPAGKVFQDNTITFPESKSFPSS